MLNIMHIQWEAGNFSAQLVCCTVGSMQKKDVLDKGAELMA